jgi:hypothetical protein
LSYGSDETLCQTFGLPFKDIEHYFFQQLMAMTSSFNHHQHHRVIAYAMDLLLCPKPKSEQELLNKTTCPSDKTPSFFDTAKRMKTDFNNIQNEFQCKNFQHVKFQDDPYFARYFVYVWGMLAVAFAAVGIEPKFALFCIQKAEKLALCLSEHIEVLLYKQKVFARFGWFQNETQVFNKLYPILPRISYFYQKTVFVHVWAAIAAVENLIFHSLLIQKMILCPLFSIKKDFITQKIANMKEANDLIKNLQTFLAEIMWKNKKGSYFNDKVQTFVEIVNLFQIMIEEMFNVSSYPMFPMETVAHGLVNLNTKNEEYFSFLKLFLKKNYVFQDYQRDVNSHSVSIGYLTATMDSVENAHFLFTQILLIYCFKKSELVFETKMYELVTNVNLVFEKYNHPRKTLTSKFFETDFLQLPKKPPPTFVNLDDYSTTNVTFDSLLQDKIIVHFIDVGSQLQS